MEVSGMLPLISITSFVRKRRLEERGARVLTDRSFIMEHFCTSRCAGCGEVYGFTGNLTSPPSCPHCGKESDVRLGRFGQGFSRRIGEPDTQKRGGE
jgi:predicted amidophosphoribosyltransferase